MLGMIAHTVVGLVYSTIGSPAGVFLLVDPALGGQSSFLALDLDGTELNFRDASASSVTISGGTSTSYFWAVSSPGWSDSDTVLVAIRTADPELTIEALNDDIPHGLGNARAAGVAEFRVTRSYVPHGETHDTSLEFNTLWKEFPDDTGGTAFDPGHATKMLRHLALDTDAQGNPVCTITFVLQPGDGYIVGSPSEATVNVKGPGTICTTAPRTSRPR